MPNHKLLKTKTDPDINRDRRGGITALFAVILVFAAISRLTLPALAETAETYCGLEEHRHTEQCYEAVLICGEESSATHTHTGDCYETKRVCGKTAHQHSLACFSDPDADVETESEWESTRPEDLSGPEAKRLIEVAESQVGYAESNKNYQVEDDGRTTRGWNRYGAREGDAYKNWSASFVSFCLHYAKSDLKAASKTESADDWRERLRDEELLKSRSYEAEAGDIVFLESSGSAAYPVDHAGIVFKTEKDKIFVIEGDRNNAVRKTFYYKTSDKILGYYALADDAPAGTAKEAKAPSSSAEPDEEEAETEDGDDISASGAPGRFITEMIVAESMSDDDTMEMATLEPPDEAEDIAEEAAEEAETDALREAAADSVLFKRQCRFEGPDYTVTAYCDERANLPADAELTVKEIESGKAYADCLAQTKAALGEESTVQSARFFDITFTSQGREIEPDATVSVRITYKDMSGGNDAALNIVHLPEESAAEILSPRAETADSVYFKADHFSIYGIIETTIEKNVLTGDGKNYKISVTYGENAEIPEGAELEAEEIVPDANTADGSSEYETYLEKTREALGLDSSAFAYARFFDIKIIDKNGRKVEIAAPVNVKIELADKEDSAEAAANTQVVHFADETAAGDVIGGAEVGGGTVRFEADGFSAYAIVEGPEALPVGWHKISSFEELIAKGSEGLYISHPDGYYYMNTTTGDSSRKGITKTKPAREYPGDNASLYYFEPVNGTENQVYAYCYAADGTTKQYVYNGGNNSLSFTDETNRTAFTVTRNSNGTFKLNNGSWYWNMQGGADGTRFCSYNAANDANNNVNFWYHVAVESDPYGLDGFSCGLMNWSGGAAGKALMTSAAAANTLDAKSLTVMSTSDNAGRLFVPNDSDIPMWTFHWLHDDQYYLTTVADGSTKYLKIEESGISLVSAEEEASQIQVTPGSGIHAGEICLKSGGTALTYSGTVKGGFSVGGDVGSEWLNLVELSELTTDYFLTYSASKVSVSDEGITNGSRVIVYTRSWNEKTLKYDYYAISSDGSLVPVYESGDSIEWVSGQINTLLWNFVEYYWEGTTDPNFYYELYSQYSEKYIAPQVTGGQILSDETIGINLNGRRDGQYYSPILAWDEENYSYTGLKVENGQIVTCPKAEAMDFYFAVMQDLNVDDTLTTVKTVDHTQYGITMKLIDFKTRKEMSDFLGNDVGGAGTTLQQGLLSTDLKNGYPTAAGGSLGKLYAEAQEVNHLFIQSTYGETGYFEYDSTQNFATLKGAKGGDFTVYKELGTYDSGGNKPTLKHGQFFPFNDLKPGTFAASNGKNLYSATAVQLPDSDPRKYERLYSIEYDGVKADCYFGAELEASFTQTPNGLDAWGHDIIFEFTGDDDFWLYVDGELIIDLGGIHSAAPGSVNFRTGDVYVNGNHTTLRELFESNYRGRNPKATDEEVAAYLGRFFDEGGTVFKDDTTHTMNIFYMERGAGASNLHMRFNLAAVKEGTVQLSKTLSGVDESGIMAEFPYQILYKRSEEEGAQEYYLTNAAADIPTQNDNYVLYKDTINPVEYEPSVTIDGTTYQDVFFLKPGETADISFPEGVTSYKIVECGVNTEIYDSVAVNGQTLTGSAVPGSDSRRDYGIDYTTTHIRPKVKYNNTVNPDALRTLTIKKQLYNEDGTTEILYPENDTEFSFRLYLASEFDALDVANMHTYHVKDPDGFYCRWDAANQKFVKIGEGISDYSSLSEDQKKSASFTTSIYGSITKIPTGFTAEVRNVLAGTQYRVEERPEEVPDGYSFQKYEGYDAVNAAVSERDDSGVPGVKGTVVSGKDAPVIVRNLKGWGLRVNKVWRDADYMSERDPVYFALFTKAADGSLTPVEGSVRQLASTANPPTLYWYYDHLPVAGTTGVEDYLIREVTLSAANPAIGDDGTVTDPGTVTPLAADSELTLNGTQKGEDTRSSFVYTVQYKEGKISSDSNVRVDTVTNDRPGIILKKQDWDGNAQQGAVFALADEKGNVLGTFTSDEEGLITTAFLSNDKEYTLTETKTPQGYHGPETAMKITLQNGEVTVTGPDEEYYTLAQANGTTLATMVIKNRPYTFRAVKQNGDTEEPLKGVKFALHRQVTVDSVTAIDLNPMPGYENLITDEDGLIPSLDNTLPPGTYELREKETLTGYETLPAYIQFTVSPIGAVTLGTHPDGVTLTGEPDADGTLEYVLTILNSQRKKVSFKKVDIADVSDSALAGAVFDLYRVSAEGGNETPALYTGLTSDENGLLKDGSGNAVFDLPPGTYHLLETEAPKGYLPKTEPVTITVTAADVTYNEGTTLSNNGRGKNYDPETKVYTLKISNNRGYELPSSGGIGTTIFTILGSAMILGGGLLLIRKRAL